MDMLLGFLVICIALSFLITFTMGDNLTVKEKVKLALGIIFVISIMAIGAYLLEPYVN